jgi:hypothetical protein
MHQQQQGQAPTAQSCGRRLPLYGGNFNCQRTPGTTTGSSSE